MKQVILMADIVDSSRKEGDELMRAFASHVEKVNTLFNSQVLSPLTITLGDEFQGVVGDISSACDIIFFMDELCLTSDPYYKLRFVLNYGEIDTPLNREKAYGMLGEGLASARERLNRMKEEGVEIDIAGFSSGFDERLTLAFRLYRSFYNDWPEKDRETAASFIQHRDYKVLAGIFGKDASTMWRKERSLKMKDFYASKRLIKLLQSDTGITN